MLVASNILVFSAYYYSQTNPNLADSIWKYLDSGQFKAITITILLPIVMLLLDNFFEIRKKRIEKKEKIRNKNIEKRWKVIADTSKAYNETCSLGEELILLDLDMDSFKNPNNETLSKSQYVGDYIKRLSFCMDSWSDVINCWQHLFKNLETINPDIKFSKQIAYILNILFDCFETVVINFGHSKNKKEVIKAKNSQFNLLPILGGFKRSVYRNMINSLKDSIEIQFGKEAKEETANDRINKNLISLRSITDSIKMEHSNYCMFFSELKNKNQKELLTKKFNEAIFADDINFQNKLKEVKDQLIKSNLEDHEDLMHSIEIPCPLEWIDHLAFWFILKRITEKITERRKKGKDSK